MKPHTPDQVAVMKSFVDSQHSDAERKTYTLNGLEVTYTTVDMGAAKPFDYAVAAFVAPRTDDELATEADYEIMVSDDVPEDLQGIWAWHELHDFDIVGHEADDRCLETERELADIMSPDPELYQQYLPIRIPFYDGLAVFIATDLDQKGDDSVYSPADLRGCYEAIHFLRAQATIEAAPSLSILNIAKIKRSELDAQALQQSDKDEERRKQQSLADLAMTAERELSRKRADEFIALMKEHNIPTVDYYQTWQETDEEKMKERRVHDSHKSNIPTKRVNNLVGKGWIIKPLRNGYHTEAGAGNFFEKGLILLKNGLAYEYSWNKLVTMEQFEIQNSVMQPHDWVGGFTPKDRIFANDEGFSLLAKYIAEQTNILNSSENQTEPTVEKAED